MQDSRDVAGRRAPALDPVGDVAALLEQAADSMERSGRRDVAASHRLQARRLREDPV